MKKKKFLTVYIIFDEQTEISLQHIQNEILNRYPYGTQTMGIPFHISLGSFPLEAKEELEKRIKEISLSQSCFDMELVGLGNFNQQVLFMEPEVNEEIVRLHSLFEGNYSDGYPWHPHVTLYCGTTEEVGTIQKELQPKIKRMSVRVTGIQMGEFFPTKLLVTEYFR